MSGESVRLVVGTTSTIWTSEIGERGFGQCSTRPNGSECGEIASTQRVKRFLGCCGCESSECAFGMSVHRSLQAARLASSVPWKVGVALQCEGEWQKPDLTKGMSPSAGVEQSKYGV